jgi:hypothetical protein
MIMDLREVIYAVIMCNWMAIVAGFILAIVIYLN